MKRSHTFIIVAVAIALLAAGCGCAAPAPSPSWNQLLSARIPSECGHKPTKLVNGRHTGIPPGDGMFQLQRTLGSRSGYVTNVPSSSGPLTAVVASCNQGGVNWPHRLLFFGPGPKFVTSTDLYEGNWGRLGLDGPARNGIESLTKTSSGLTLAVRAYRPTDARCCYSANATVKLKVSGGKVVITSIHHR